MKTDDAYRKTFSMALITVVVFAVTLLNSALQADLVQWLLVMVTVLSTVSALITSIWVHRSKRAWAFGGVSVLYLALFIGMLIVTYFALVAVWLHPR